MASKPPTAIRASNPPNPASNTSRVPDRNVGSPGPMPSVKSTLMTSVYKNGGIAGRRKDRAHCPYRVFQIRRPDVGVIYRPSGIFRLVAVEAGGKFVLLPAPPAESA